MLCDGTERLNQGNSPSTHDRLETNISPQRACESLPGKERRANRFDDRAVEHPGEQTHALGPASSGWVTLYPLTMDTLRNTLSAAPRSQTLCLFAT